MLENGIVSKKCNPGQSYDRSFCKDKLAKNSYQYYQITVDNKRINESFRDEAKSKNDKNKTSNSTTLIEPIDKFIDELLEGQEVSSSELDPTPALSIANALKKELESRHLPLVDFLTFYGNPNKWPKFIENFKTRVYNKVSFTNTMRMKRLLSVLKGEVKRVVEGLGTNGIFYPTALELLKRESGNPVVVCHLKMKELFDQPPIKRNDRTSFRKYYQLVKCNNTWLLSMGYHHALKSTETISKAVQRLPNHLRHSFSKYSQIHIDRNKPLSLFQFEKWLEITVRQYFNPIANIIASQESNKFKQRISQEFTRNNHLQSDSLNNSTIKCWLCSEAHKLPSCPKSSQNH